jgi:DNA-binding MarR family transcriptional regulator
MPRGDAAAGRALTDLVLEVFRLNGRLLAAGDRLVRPVGQTSARWQVLGAVMLVQRTVSQIAREMGLTRQSVQRTADRLEADGLVTYAENPANRRAGLVTLSPRGKSILDWILREEKTWSDELGAPLGETRIRAALRVIRSLRQALEVAERAHRARRSPGRAPASSGARRKKGGKP